MGASSTPGNDVKLNYMKQFFPLFSAVLIIASTFSCGTFALASTESLKIPYFQQDIQLDGQLDEEVWQRARAFSLEYVTEPYENTAPPVSTKAYVFESGDMLYVGFVADDIEPDKVRANLRDRDKVWNDDLVGFRLDTFGTHKLAYHFYVNPRSVQIDSIESEITGRRNDDWDAVWSAQSAITATGYSVEFAIPLSELSFGGGAGEKQWAIELLRSYPRNVRYRISNRPIDKNNDCSLCQLQPVTGFAHSTQGSNLNFVPYLAVTQGGSRDVASGENWQVEHKAEVGADIHWRIASDTLFSATINPDFSQIEADEAQLSLNTNAALYFPEKRRFFLKGQDQFASNYNLVHTRNLVAPDVGAKYIFTGEKHTLAALAANDQSTILLIPGSLGSRSVTFEEKNVSAAARYRHDLGDGSSVGVTSTLRESESYHNYLAAIDGKIRFTESTSLQGQILASDTQYPAYLSEQLRPRCDAANCHSEASLRTSLDQDLTDYAWELELNHDTRNWWAEASHKENGKGFRADLGFEGAVDYKETELRIGRVYYPEDSTWTEVEFRGGGERETNMSNELISEDAEIQLRLSGAKQSFLMTGLGTAAKSGKRRRPETLAIANNAPLYDLDFAFMFGHMRPASDLYMSMLILKGGDIDYANNRKAEKLRWEPVVQWDVSEHFDMRIKYRYENLDAEDDDVYIARLTDLRSNYQFSAASKLRLSVIYNDISRNPDNYIRDVDAKYQSMGMQLVYSYRFDALSAFYLGYSDNAFEDDQITTMTRQEKNFFAKISYSL